MAARTGVLFAVAMAVVFCAAVSAEDNGKQGEHRGKEQVRREAPHRDQRRESHGYGHGNYYPQPVYVPPVVVYAPPQSPGISLFIPLELHLR